MKRIAFLFAACLAGSTAFAQPAEESPPAAGKGAAKAAPRQKSSEPAFGWFGEIVNACWAGMIKEKNEHTHCYIRQFERFIRGSTRLAMERNGKMQTVFAGDSVFAWDPVTRKITYYSWGSDGTHLALQASYIGDDLVFPSPSRADPSKIVSRSVWKRIDKDTFEVRRERPDGQGWKEDHTVTYRRVPKPSGETKEK